jgi:hypothetical protein
MPTPTSWESRAPPTRSSRLAPGCPPRDAVLTDRDEQHRAALGHHPANAVGPPGAVRSGACLHLFIAGFPAPTTTVTWPRACPRVPLPKVARGQQRSLTSPVAEYPLVSLARAQDLDHRFQAGDLSLTRLSRSEIERMICSPSVVVAARLAMGEDPRHASRRGGGLLGHGEP